MNGFSTAQLYSNGFQETVTGQDISKTDLVMMAGSKRWDGNTNHKKLMW